LIGTGIGLFEEFYAQSQRGKWLRRMHPLRAILVYTAVVAVFYIAAAHLSRLLLGRLDDLPVVYQRLPLGLTIFTIFSVVGVLIMRVIHFVGLGNLFSSTPRDLSPARPTKEDFPVRGYQRIDGYRRKARRPVDTSFRRKFLLDRSAPIIDYGREVYLYKGGGLIAVWSWTAATRGDAILKSVDAAFTAIERERDVYMRLFKAIPSFRIGWRCGRERAGRHEALDRHLRRRHQYRGPNGRSCRRTRCPMRPVEGGGGCAHRA
jgi:hypothetical protein